MRKTSAILAAAIERITPKASWTVGAMARDRNGRPTSVHGADAVCFCFEGAIVRETGPWRGDGGEDVDRSGKVQEDLARVGLEWVSAMTVNDRHGHAAILLLTKGKVAELEALGL